MSKHAIAAAATLLLGSASGALAEVEARAIWSDWQEVYARVGAALAAGSEDYADDRLTLSDVTVTTEVGENTSSASYGTIILEERDDGTVEILLPETVETTTTTTVEDVEQSQTTALSHEGLSIIASEGDGLRSYDIAADSATLTTSVAEGPQTAASDLVMRVTDLVSVYRSGENGDPDAFAQTLAASGLEIAVTIGDGTGEQTSASIDYALTGLNGEITGDYGPLPEAPISSFSQTALTYDGQIRHSGGTLAMVAEGPRGPFTLESEAGAGHIDMAMDGDSLAYATGSDDLQLTMQLPGFPLPLDVTASEVTSGIVLPFGPPEAIKPLGLSLAYRDVTLDDAIWGLFDPTGQLPRDPATLVLDLDGTAELMVDLFGDPEAFAARDEAPGELKTLDLNELLLDVAGATLQGSGALTFPTPDPSAPLGAIDLTLDGGFALVDSLVALGFLPAEQAGFVKGMAGAVARPTGDDQLETTIEFIEGGGITANGFPLR